MLAFLLGYSEIRNNLLNNKKKSRRGRDSNPSTSLCLCGLCLPFIYPTDKIMLLGEHIHDADHRHALVRQPCPALAAEQGDRLAHP
jgi:hypothetical protein